jgi:signal transduction histidine kinase
VRTPGPRLVSVVAAFAIAVLGIGLLAIRPAAAYREPSAVAAVFVLAAAATMLWWRTRPVVSLVLAAAVVVSNAAAGFTVGGVQYPVYLALFGVLAWAPRSHRWGALLFAVVGVVGYAVADRATVPTSTLVGVSATCLIAMFLGDSIRSRRELAESQELTHRMQDLERSAAMEMLVLEQRAALARELHDSVGHAINVMVMQAGVGRHVFAERPGFALDALQHVEELGRIALGELDVLLRVLRPLDGVDGVDEPVGPVLAELETLCGRIRTAGRPVELRVDPVRLSPSASRTVHRIVQEALTNAVRHTASGPISVTVACNRPDATLEVTVWNALTRPIDPTPGRGLVNMRERCAMEGGQLHYGSIEGGFRVHARLPLAAIEAVPK